MSPVCMINHSKRSVELTIPLSPIQRIHLKLSMLVLENFVWFSSSSSSAILLFPDKFLVCR